MKCAMLLLLAASLSACTIVSHERVADWPQLQVVEHSVPEAEMRDRCGKYVAFGFSPLACAEFHFEARRCDVWYSADFPPSRAVIEHERLHCAGHDHIGGGTMHELLQEYRARQRLANLPAPTESASTGATWP